MNLRALLVIALLAGVAGWWFSDHRRSLRAPPAASGESPACPLPPRVATGEPPLQSDVPDDLPPFALEAATLMPLAGFSLEARVLSRKDYRSGREAALSPVDLALGWQRMEEDAVIEALDIRQSSRWYHYRWRDQPPLPTDEILGSSANMHMIPGNDGVAQALADVRKDERVRIDGWLVEAKAEDGWRWRSSTRRTDTGSGACELVYVCGVTRL
ncbi:hypothetical protein ASD77_10110 [Pseudoxanthomonas sp. Root65]|uniref:hypothetical protein n=1 Tax=Pseudoxanthomonas sp. Root65 TaxID=1736576 RepID=UPI0006FA74EE|nr:hypothetical protein [Pseudoxanthomonas sp. Root65]KRA54908.1 hypothetical protein ASD77_10110 [Pseudoxanthomonas sp. Root65]